MKKKILFISIYVLLAVGLLAEGYFLTKQKEGLLGAFPTHVVPGGTITSADMNAVFDAVSSSNPYNVSYTGHLTISSASSTNQTITNLWVTNFSPTNASTTNLTVSSFISLPITGLAYSPSSGATLVGTSTLDVLLGGTGATTLSGILFGNGAAPFTTTSTLAINFGGTGATSFTGSNLVITSGNASQLISSSTLDIVLGGTNSTSFTNNNLVVSNGNSSALISSSTLDVLLGGTGATTLTGILWGRGAAAFTASSTVALSVGGTGVTSFTANNLVVSNGNASQLISSSTLDVLLGGTGVTTITGILQGNGAAAFTSSSTIGISVGGTGVTSFTANNLAVSNGNGSKLISSSTLDVLLGGSGATTLSGFLYGNGAAAFTATTTPFLNNIFFNNATSSNSFFLPYNATLALSQGGQMGIDSTTGQLRWQTPTETVAINGYNYRRFFVSTSTAWSGTTTLFFTGYDPETWKGAICKTDAGTLNVSISDGTNYVPMFTASTTKGTESFTSNNTFTAAENQQIEIGTPASSPTRIDCNIKMAITQD